MLSRDRKKLVLCAQSLQLCLTLCDPMDCCPPGSSVHGILQARILEWVAMPSSRESSRPRDRTHISCISRRILYPLSDLGSPERNLPVGKRWLEILSPSYLTRKTNKQKHFVYVNEWFPSDSHFSVPGGTTCIYSKLEMRSIHVTDIVLFFLLFNNPLYMCTTSSVSIPLSMDI